MKKRSDYNTKQRERIIEFFMNNPSQCYTSSQIISQRISGVSDATVYRLLSKLSDEKLLKKYTDDCGRGYLYQYNGSDEHNSHFHLKCIKCGELIHTDCPEFAEIIRHFSSEHCFSIDMTQTVIYGKCNKCL